MIAVFQAILVTSCGAAVLVWLRFLAKWRLENRLSFEMKVPWIAAAITIIGGVGLLLAEGLHPLVLQESGLALAHSLVVILMFIVLLTLGVGYFVSWAHLAKQTERRIRQSSIGHASTGAASSYRIEDVSLTGAFLRTNALKPGQHLTLNLQLDKEEPVHVKAVVVRRQKPTWKRIGGVGVRFELDEHDPAKVDLERIIGTKVDLGDGETELRFPNLKKIGLTLAVGRNKFSQYSASPN